ncbi:hypothetical protein P364_0114140 [Paenibacillus sp. MAEPY2]|nr:hypothetical protein P364_0114140 [Paenibacillus sp. MAEPY2]KGP86044.1 hypothetical protein P363_0119615 [Paenibacillus sp. MAEPY1]
MEFLRLDWNKFEKSLKEKHEENSTSTKEELYKIVELIFSDTPLNEIDFSSFSIEDVNTVLNQSFYLDSYDNAYSWDYEQNAKNNYFNIFYEQTNHRHYCGHFRYMRTESNDDFI